MIQTKQCPKCKKEMIHDDKTDPKAMYFCTNCVYAERGKT